MSQNTQYEEGSTSARLGTTDNIKGNLKSHGEHDMTLITEEQRSPYECTGCKEFGIGDKYICNEDCSFVLHPECRLYNEHEFLNGSTFRFFQEHLDKEQRYCDACGRDIKGYFYHCNETDKDLHPCCLNLQKMIQAAEVKFKVLDKLKSKCLLKKKVDKMDKCLESESMSAREYVKRKLTKFFEWARKILNKISQFLKLAHNQIQKATPILKKVKIVLENMIIYLELIKKFLAKISPLSKSATMHLEQVTQIFGLAIIVLDCLLALLSGDTSPDQQSKST